MTELLRARDMAARGAEISAIAAGADSLDDGDLCALIGVVAGFTSASLELEEDGKLRLPAKLIAMMIQGGAALIRVLKDRHGGELSLLDHATIEAHRDQELAIWSPATPPPGSN